MAAKGARKLGFFTRAIQPWHDTVKIHRRPVPASLRSLGNECRRWNVAPDFVIRETLLTAFSVQRSEARRLRRSQRYTASYLQQTEMRKS